MTVGMVRTDVISDCEYSDEDEEECNEHDANACVDEVRDGVHDPAAAAVGVAGRAAARLRSQRNTNMRPSDPNIMRGLERSPEDDKVKLEAGLHHSPDPAVPAPGSPLHAKIELVEVDPLSVTGSPGVSFIHPNSGAPSSSSSSVHSPQFHGMDGPSDSSPSMSSVSGLPAALILNQSHSASHSHSQSHSASTSAASSTGNSPSLPPRGVAVPTYSPHSPAGSPLSPPPPAAASSPRPNYYQRQMMRHFTHPHSQHRDRSSSRRNSTHSDTPSATSSSHTPVPRFHSDGGASSGGLFDSPDTDMDRSEEGRSERSNSLGSLPANLTAAHINAQHPHDTLEVVGHGEVTNMNEHQHQLPPPAALTSSCTDESRRNRVSSPVLSVRSLDSPASGHSPSLSPRNDSSRPPSPSARTRSASAAGHPYQRKPTSKRGSGDFTSARTSVDTQAAAGAGAVEMMPMGAGAGAGMVGSVGSIEPSSPLSPTTQTAGQLQALSIALPPSPPTPSHALSPPQQSHLLHHQFQQHAQLQQVQTRTLAHAASNPALLPVTAPAPRGMSPSASTSSLHRSTGPAVSLRVMAPFPASSAYAPSSPTAMSRPSSAAVKPKQMSNRHRTNKPPQIAAPKRPATAAAAGRPSNTMPDHSRRGSTGAASMDMGDTASLMAAPAHPAAAWNPSLHAAAAAAMRQQQQPQPSPLFPPQLQASYSSYALPGPALLPLHQLTQHAPHQSYPGAFPTPSALPPYATAMSSAPQQHGLAPPPPVALPMPSASVSPLVPLAPSSSVDQVFMELTDPQHQRTLAQLPPDQLNRLMQMLDERIRSGAARIQGTAAGGTIPQAPQHFPPPVPSFPSQHQQHQQQQHQLPFQQYPGTAAPAPSAEHVLIQQIHALQQQLEVQGTQLAEYDRQRQAYLRDMQHKQAMAQQQQQQQPPSPHDVESSALQPLPTDVLSQLSPETLQQMLDLNQLQQQQLAQQVQHAQQMEQLAQQNGQHQLPQQQQHLQQAQQQPEQQQQQPQHHPLHPSPLQQQSQQQPQHPLQLQRQQPQQQLQYQHSPQQLQQQPQQQQQQQIPPPSAPHRELSSNSADGGLSSPFGSRLLAPLSSDSQRSLSPSNVPTSGVGGSDERENFLQSPFRGRLLSASRADKVSDEELFALPPSRLGGSGGIGPASSSPNDPDRWRREAEAADDADRLEQEEARRWRHSQLHAFRPSSDPEHAMLTLHDHRDGLHAPLSLDRRRSLSPIHGHHSHLGGDHHLQLDSSGGEHSHHHHHMGLMHAPTRDGSIGVHDEPPEHTDGEMLNAYAP